MKRPPFSLGAGGCRCVSCKETAQYTQKGFAAWPRGNPAGRKSAAEYAAHVAHGKQTTDRLLGESYRTLHPEPRFSPSNATGYAPPITRNMEAIRWNAGKGQISKGPGLQVPALARPTAACKPPQHFPAQIGADRASASIYGMDQDKVKRSVGRPKVEGGKRFLVLLDPADAARAKALGNGDLTAGIRAALKGAPDKVQASG